MTNFKTLYERLEQSNRDIADMEENYMMKSQLQGNFTWGTLPLVGAIQIHSKLTKSKLTKNSFNLSELIELFRED